MTDKEALNLAQIALENLEHSNFKRRRLDALIAVKQALAQPVQEPDIAEIEKIMLEVWQPVSPEQDGKCKHCTDGCPACDARKLTKEAHDLL